MSRRSTRSSSRPTQPNAAYYVGYVEDDETPEMIMRKFEQMEKLKELHKASQKKPKPNTGKSDKAEMSDDSDEENNGDTNNNGGALSEDLLNQVFVQTSLYSMNSLKRNNEICFTKQTVDEDGFVVGFEDPEYENLMFEVDYNVADTEMMHWTKPDEDDYIGEDAFWGDDDTPEKKKQKRSRKKGSQSRGTRRSGFQMGGIGHASLGGGEGGSKAKAKILCHQPFYMKIPNYPIPRSWGIVLQPYLEYPKDVTQIKGYTYMERDLLSMTTIKDYCTKINDNQFKPYKAILMDPPFDLSDSPVVCDEDKDKGCVTLEDFAKLPMGQLIPESGMLFIWVPSELTIQINKICLNWGYYLVEHATWAMRNLKWQIKNERSKLLGISKWNLLLFRRTKRNGKAFGKLELRHQRTSDSYFDYVRMHPETGRDMKPDYHYKMIETLLPCLDELKGEALFLWAPKNEVRPGWQMVCDTKYLAKLSERKPNMDIGDW